VKIDSAFAIDMHQQTANMHQKVYKIELPDPTWWQARFLTILDPLPKTPKHRGAEGLYGEGQW